MREHLRILGVLYLVSGGLYLLGALIVATALTGTGVLMRDWGSVAFLSGLGVVIGVFLAALGLPGLIVGWGLLKLRSWSRVPGFVLGFLNLLNFPFGTLLGGYTLWVLFQPAAERLLSAPTEAWEP